jgi:hypothetical protein
MRSGLLQNAESVKASWPGWNSCCDALSIILYLLSCKVCSGSRVATELIYIHGAVGSSRIHCTSSSEVEETPSISKLLILYPIAQYVSPCLSLCVGCRRWAGFSRKAQRRGTSSCQLRRQTPHSFSVCAPYHPRKHYMPLCMVLCMSQGTIGHP